MASSRDLFRDRKTQDGVRDAGVVAIFGVILCLSLVALLLSPRLFGSETEAATRAESMECVVVEAGLSRGKTEEESLQRAWARISAEPGEWQLEEFPSNYSVENSVSRLLFRDGQFVGEVLVQQSGRRAWDTQVDWSCQ